MTTPPQRAGALLAALACTLGACADDANDHALQARRLADRLAAERSVVAVAAVERTGVVVPVAARDNSFEPLIVEAKVGDEVVWENRGSNKHDVLSIEGTLAAGTAWGMTVEQFQPGAIYAHVFTEPGEYRYYCTVHGTTDVGMVGTVIVTA